MEKKGLVKILMLLPLALVALSLTSCNKRLGKTSVYVMDSLRHYYSVIQGQEITLTYRIANVGDTALIFSDIQPSCGCISVEGEKNNVILPHSEGKLAFKFSTEKYSGYVHHVIRCFGNVEPDGVVNLMFDTHVVPPYHGSPDYEDVYYKWLSENARLDGLMDEAANERGYWTDQNSYSKDHKRYIWKEDSGNETRW